MQPALKEGCIPSIGPGLGFRVWGLGTCMRFLGGVVNIISTEKKAEICVSIINSNDKFLQSGVSSSHRVSPSSWLQSPGPTINPRSPNRYFLGFRNVAA